MTYRSLPPRRGIPVGLDERASYEVAPVMLAEGGIPLPYTDGMAQAMDREPEQFGIHCLVDCLGERPVSSARELVDRINWAVE